MSANYSMNPVVGTVPTAATRNPIYFISIIGALAAAGSVFLPWYNMTSSLGDTSENELGMYTGSLSNLMGNDSPIIGLGVIGAAVVILVLAILGWTMNNRFFAVINLIISLLLGGFGALVTAALASKANDDTAAAASINAVFSVGIASYVTLAALGVVFLGSVIAILVRRR